ncbi:MAG: WD40-like Beta Propeller [Chlorobi bacterium OLB5]|nr:MAG: WD40-like Beta Propeller [Chlorobi bacterium OLB5]
MKNLLLSALFLIVISSTLFSQKNLIVFSSDATKNDKQQIFIMDEEGDNVKQISFMNLDCYSPKFIPHTNKIVFSATNRISDYLYMIDLDDTATFRFPNFIDGGIDHQFSADGTMLMYRSEKEENNAVYIMDLVSGEVFPISDGSLATHAEFSHDGQKVVYSTSITENFDLAILNLTDTSDNAQKTIVASKDAEIYGTYSPDDTKIAFASFDINYKGTLKVCDANGKNVKVISSGGSSYNPKWSPDGKYLAYVSDKSGKFQIYICKPDGSSLKQLTGESGNVVEYNWSPDGSKIIFDSQSEGVSAIWLIDVEKGSKQNLTGSKANNITPDFKR